MSVSARATTPSGFAVADIDPFAVWGVRDSARGAPEIARTPISARAPVATIHPRQLAVFFSFMTFLLGEE